MTNFVIVYYLALGAQPWVLHSRRGAALGIFSVPYSKLYCFSLSAKWQERQLHAVGWEKTGLSNGVCKVHAATP